MGSDESKRLSFIGLGECADTVVRIRKSDAIGSASENVKRDIGEYLEMIRRVEKEIVMCIGAREDGSEILFTDEGVRFSSAIDIEKAMRSVYHKECDLVIVHNHPSVGKASPSKADMVIAETISNTAADMRKKGLQVNILDFAIVT